MSRKITEQLLEEDNRLYTEMVMLYGRYQFNPTTENKEKYDELKQKYYVDNDDIRIYYKTI